MPIRRTHGTFLAITAVIAFVVCAPVGAVIVEEKAQPHDCRRVGSPVAAARSAPSDDEPRAEAAAGFPGVQLEMRTPFEPTAFPSAGRHYVVYELHLRNFGRSPLGLERMDISGADAAAQPLASFNAAELVSLVDPTGDRRSPEAADQVQLGSGEGTVAFVCLAFDRGVEVPTGLRHRIQMADGIIAEGPVMGTRNTELRALAPPVAGPDWIAGGGPGCNQSHHRLGLVVADGRATIARRHGTDWKQIKNGSPFSGNALDPRSYHAYGENVLAVADATVVAASDGIPDNVPRTAAGFTPAVAVTMETIGGNDLMLDLGDGQFAYYAHLQAGSLGVKVGDRVQRGQVLARIGNSGDAREPHLHFQVTTGPQRLAAEGVPYVIDRYRVQLADDSWAERRHELPVMGALVDFEPAPAAQD